MTATHARIRDLPTSPLRDLAAELISTRTDDDALGVALGIGPTPEGLTYSDGLRRCAIPACDAWFWAEHGGVKFVSRPAFDGNRIIESAIERLCPDHYPDDHGNGTGEHYAPCLLLAWSLTDRKRAAR